MPRSRIVVVDGQRYILTSRGMYKADDPAITPIPMNPADVVQPAFDQAKVEKAQAKELQRQQEEDALTIGGELDKIRQQLQSMSLKSAKRRN